MPSPSCPLKQVEAQELAAKQFGFYWEHIDQLIEQIHNECVEVREAWEKKDRAHLQEEMGDLLQAAASLAVFCNLDPHDTLLKGAEKFQKRFDTVVELVKDEGHQNLRNQPFDVLLSYWRRAKQTHGK